MVVSGIPFKLLGQTHLQQEQQNKEDNHRKDKLITTLHSYLLSILAKIHA